MPTLWNLTDNLGGAPHLWLPPQNIVQTAGVATSWTDQSGAAHPLPLTVGAPTTVVLQNGLNGANFDGITQQMSTQSSTGSQLILPDPYQFHAFAIVKPTGPGGASALVPGSNPAMVAENSGRWGLFYYTTGGNDFIQAAVYDGAYHFAQAQANRGSVYLVEWWLDPTDQIVRMRINAGAAVAGTAMTGPQQISTFAYFILGAGSSAGVPIHQACVIGEVFVSSRMLKTGSAALRARADIASRWRQAA